MAKRRLKADLIKDLQSQIRQTSKALRELKGVRGGKRSLAFSSTKSLLENARKMAKTLKNTPRTTKITKADIQLTSKLLEEAQTNVEEETTYFIGVEAHEWDFVEPIDESVLYRIARELIEEGYGSAESIGAVEEMKSSAYPTSWNEFDVKNEMLKIMNNYITDIKERQQQEREEFERGFNKGNTRF